MEKFEKINDFAMVGKIIKRQKKNTPFVANSLYGRLYGKVSYASFYKILERLCLNGELIHLSKGLYYRPAKTRFGQSVIPEESIISYYVRHEKGLVIGYRLYNEKKLTTQISKNIEIMSSNLLEQKKRINNVTVEKMDLLFSEENVRTIQILEILQHFRDIEDLNYHSFTQLITEYTSHYSEKAVVNVLKKRKYKQSTIAFLRDILVHYKVKNDLNRYLSPLSNYHTPLEQIHELA